MKSVRVWRLDNMDWLMAAAGVKVGDIIEWNGEQCKITAMGDGLRYKKVRGTKTLTTTPADDTINESQK